MKKVFSTFALILTAMASFSQVNSHTINLVDFHSISCNSKYTVYVKQSNKEEVRVEALKEIYEVSEFVVKEGVLHININKADTKESKSVWAKIDDIKILPTLKVYVSIKDVKALSVNGSGSMITENSIASEAINLQLTGSGNMEIDLKGKIVNAKLAGPGNLKLTGYANELTVEQSGSGDLDAFKFEVGKANTHLYGIGNANLFVIDTLEATIYGSGNMKVKGATKNITKNIYGSGTLERAY